MFKGKCYHCGSKTRLVRHAYAFSWWSVDGRKIVYACDQCIIAGKGIHV